MPVTLADARRLTQDKLAQIVIDEFRQDDLLNRMLFDDNASYNGGSTLNYVYNRVDYMRDAGFRAINTEYTADQATTYLVTVTLKPFGGTYAIDRVIADHVHGVTDQIAFQQEQLIKATIATFSDTFINGDVAVNAQAFDGLDKAIAGSSTEMVLPTVDLSTSASIDSNWKVFMDGLRRLAARLDGSTTMICVNRDMYSVFQSIADRATSFTLVRSDVGKETLAWNSIPIVVLGDKPASSNPIIPVNATTGVTSLYMVRIGLDGVHAVSPQGGRVIRTWLPDYTNVNAVQLGGTEMVAAMALKATRAAGVLRGMKIA